MATRPDVPEQRTIDVDVQDIDTRGKTLVGYAAVYGATSEDLGGFKERIAAGAFSGVLDSDVRALLNHDPSQVLGRTKSGTLRLSDEQRGLRFEIDLPDSPLGENVREAVRRGDIDGASFRFQVDRESWDGDLRTVETVKELKDITVATFGAYPDASVELRTRPNTNTAAPAKEGTMATEAEKNTDEKTEERTEETRMPAGSLRVEERAERPMFQTLTEAFRSRGFPGDLASITFDEYRDLAYTGGSVNANAPNRVSAQFGADQRYLWQAVPQVGVDSAATSADVFQQTARTLPAGTAVLRAIDAVTTKPEVAQTATITNVPFKQIAVIESNIPNIYLERPEVSTIVETDLRLALNEGLDATVLAGLATSGFQAADAPTANLTSIRAAMTTIMASGYTPDTLVQTPASAQALDLLVSGLTGGTADYSWGAGQFAGQVFGLRTVVSKNAAAPIVLDSTANGKLYMGPVSLARFEVDAGATNRSNVRMETNGVYGVERTAAAVRIAAS